MLRTRPSPMFGRHAIGVLHPYETHRSRARSLSAIHQHHPTRADARIMNDRGSKPYRA